MWFPRGRPRGVPADRHSPLPRDGHGELPADGRRSVPSQLAKGATPLPEMASARRTDSPSVTMAWA